MSAVTPMPSHWRPARTDQKVPFSPKPLQESGGAEDEALEADLLIEGCPVYATKRLFFAVEKSV
jgi:hypothetical protein